MSASPFARVAVSSSAAVLRHAAGVAGRPERRIRKRIPLRRISSSVTLVPASLAATSAISFASRLTGLFCSRSSIPPGRLKSAPAKYQRGILPAEPEAVAQGHVHTPLAGLVGHVVQVALWVRLLVVDGRRDHPVLDRLDADYGLYGPRGSDEVTHHRLGRAHGDFARR